MSSARRSSNSASTCSRPIRRMNRRTAGAGRVCLDREHVVADEVGDVLDRGLREAKPAEDRRGLLGPDHVVVVEPAVGERRRLADVVEQRGQPDDRPLGGRGVDGPQRVVPQVLARHLVLRDPALGRELRDDHGQQARVRRDAAARPTGAAPPAAATARRRRARPTRGRPARRWPRSPRGSPASIARSCVAARRTARTIRSASSCSRASGSPTARRVPASEVAQPAERVDQDRVATSAVADRPGRPRPAR